MYDFNQFRAETSLYFYLDIKHIQLNILSVELFSCELYLQIAFHEQDVLVEICTFYIYMVFLSFSVYWLNLPNLKNKM